MRLSGKKNQLFYACMITGGLLMSCHSEALTQKENSEEKTPSTDLYHMQLIAQEKTFGKGRASIDEGSFEEGKNTTFRWDAGDKLMIWTGLTADKLSPCLFETKTGGIKSATFEYAGPFIESNVYFGFYPYSEQLQYADVRATVPTDGSIVQEALGKSTHLGAYRPMYTNVVKRQESSEILEGLQFKHLTSLLCFKLKNGMGREVNLQSVTVRCSESVFLSALSLTFNPTEGKILLNANEQDKTNSTKLTFGKGNTGLAWENNNITWGFLPTLPVPDLNGRKLSVTVQADGSEYASLDVDGAQLAAFQEGYYYVFRLVLRPAGLSIDSSVEEWKPGESTEIPVD